MKEPNIDKNVLGKLIQYYRTQKKISRQYIMENVDELSLSTLKRLENGDNCKIAQYKKVCSTLDINLLVNEVPYKEIRNLLKSTLNIINSGKPIKESQKLKEELIAFNDIYKDYIYLNDLSILGINVLSLCLDVKIFNQSNIKIADHVFASCNDKTIKTLSSFLLYTYSALFLRIEDYYRKYLSYHKNIDCFTVNKIQDSFFDLYSMDAYDAYAKHKDRYAKTKKENLLEYYANSYIYGIICTFSGKANKAIEIFDSVLNTSDKQEIIPLITKVSCHHFLAYAYFYSGDNQKAYENYMFVYNVNPGLLEISYCYLFKILELENNIALIIDIVKANINTSFGLASLLLEYYKLKYIDKAQNRELCKYIIKNFKYSNIKSKICFDFFEKEIYEIVKESNLYKLYFEFIGDMHKNKRYILAIEDSSFL